MKTLIIGMGNIGIMHGRAFSETGIDMPYMLSMRERIAKIA
jgi:S-adenosylmethionine synthetase